MNYIAIQVEEVDHIALIDMFTAEWWLNHVGAATTTENPGHRGLIIGEHSTVSADSVSGEIG